jgi:putative sugar O-methyltransferase
LAGRDSTRTSITDQADYLAFAQKAASDDAAFASFRRSAAYIDALEHVTVDQGAAYIVAIKRDNPDLLADIRRFRRNDDCGSPLLVNYAETGPISPVTLRYLKVASDLSLLFGDLKGMDIVEIGVGYGGQCRLICELWQVRSYVLIDLPPALAITRRFLETLGGVGPVAYQPPDSLSVGPVYDLCISNYAFTELSRAVQDQYASQVLSTASRGYLTCNFISSVHGIDSWTTEALASLHEGTHWLPEEPLTHPRNKILVWGDGTTMRDASSRTALTTG